MGDGALAAFRNTERPADSMAATDHQAVDRQLRTGRVIAVADGAGHPPAQLGAIGIEGAEQLALSHGSVWHAVRVEMDAASHRTAKTQSGEPVSSTLNAGLDSRPTAGHTLPAGDDSCLVPVAEGYERWAPTYDHVPNPLLAREERYLLPLLTDLTGKVVFDVACGTGRWLERLVALGSATGVGIDRSAAMLRVARNKSAIRQRLVEGDCENLPFSR